MKDKIRIRLRDLLFALVLMLPSCLVVSQTIFSIVPEPNSIVAGSGSFSLSGSTTIAFAEPESDLGSYLEKQIEYFTHLQLSKAASVLSSSNVISLVVDSTLATFAPEEYSLNVSTEKVLLTARTKEGLFHGIQSLLQLIPFPESGDPKILQIPCCEIRDAPRFHWRGLNLDCVRHFMTKDFIKRYIDLLAYYKFNVFHWHLTDDQGWRIEIKQYPKLTEVGAWRKEPDGTTYGGFYTQDDIREIVSYAKSRFINVVPEIEMPGHCEASLASYPEHACIPGPFTVGIRWGVYKDIYNPGKEETFTFLENVLTEVLDLFPSTYIHIGGDEVPKNEWKDNALCQKLVQKNGLKNEEELQSYFIRRIQQFLKSHGRGIVGWDEILEGKGPDTGATVESWRGVGGAVQAVQSGLNTIVSPGDYTYLSQDPELLSIDSVYAFDPMPPELSGDQQNRVLGTEASMWSEHAPQQTVDSKMFPRLLALAEDAWTLPEHKNLEDFHRRLNTQYDRLGYLGVDYGLEKKALTVASLYDASKRAFLVDLTVTQPNVRAVYTIGDTLTLANSRPYESPVILEGTSTFIAQAELKGRLVGNPITLSFITDAALGASVSVLEPFSTRYPAKDVGSLADGIRGTLNFRDGLWQGYDSTDIDATVDLGAEKAISELGAGFFQESGSWIFMPDSVEYFVSYDGKQFEKIGSVLNNVPQQDPDAIKKDFVLKFDPMSVRYVRLSAHNIGACPPWHPGAGGKTWLFIDEIFVN